jgi:hypothetical protein
LAKSTGYEAFLNISLPSEEGETKLEKGISRKVKTNNEGW